MIGTPSGLRAYMGDRGIIAPGADVDTLAAQALQRATDYIEAFYLNRFAVSFNAQSPNVEPAVYEAAVLELDEPGFWNQTHTPGERTVLTEVKGIRWEVIPGAKGNDPTPISSRIEALLAPYMASRGIGFTVI